MAKETLAGDNFHAELYYRLKNRGNKPIKLRFVEHPESSRTLEINEAFSIKGSTVLRSEVLQQDIKDAEQEGILTVRDLGLKIGRNYIVRNKTARRIGIHGYDAREPLILPAFGSRVLTSNLLCNFDILPWQRQSLIQVDSVSQRIKNETILSIIGFAVIAFILFLAVTIPLAIFFPGIIGWEMIGIVSVVSIVVLLLGLYFAERTENVGELGSSLANWLKLVPGIIMVLVVGIGLPLGAVYFFGEGKTLFVLETGSPAALGRLMQITFISIAAILPALLYYLFGRLQIQKQRDGFFRETMLLDPNVQSYSEAVDKYDPLIHSVYGSGNSPFAVLLLAISTALLVMGWVITLSPIGPAPADPGRLVSYFTPNPTPFTLGFLGAYFFAINMIFRRYVRADLTPKTYAYITVRLLITMVLVWAVSTLPLFRPGSMMESVLMAFCFLIGIFPDTGLAAIKDFVRSSGRGLFKHEADEGYPLSDLEGINLYDRTRLLEEGIENIENLAHHNLIELIARTRIPTPRLLDMFDQAILYIHIGIFDQDTHGNGPHAAEQGRELLAELKTYGIRTATNLINALERRTKNTGSLDRLLNEQKAQKLRVIVDAIRHEEWLNFIINWDQLNKSSEVIEEPYAFYRPKGSPDTGTVPGAVSSQPQNAFAASQG